MAEGSREAIGSDDEVVSAAEVRDLKKQIRELQRVLGKKTLENEILREAVQLAHEKNYYRVCRRCHRTIRREYGGGYVRCRAFESRRTTRACEEKDPRLLYPGRGRVGAAGDSRVDRTAPHVRLSPSHGAAQ